jgi:hypothetical protein
MTFAQHYEAYPIELKSDKGHGHDYINGYYSNEFTDKKHLNLNIVEIGVNRGQSILLLGDWFTNSNIVGIDDGRELYDEWKTITSHLSNVSLLMGDAYSDYIVEQFEDDSIDYLIDDGPHTIQSQIDCVQKWFKKIKPGGKLIIEDIQNIDEDKYKFDDLGIEYELIDLRKNNNKYDDILLIFKK